MPRISSLECSRCRHRVSADSAQTVCSTCSGFLFVRYDMEEIKRTVKRPAGGDAGIGSRRYAEVLPDFASVSLSEGGTPLLAGRQFSGLFVKDEGRNPTGSFEDRGMALAVAAAKHYGIQELSLASRGEAAAALTAYAAATGIETHVFLPQNATMVSRLECVAFGGQVTIVKGLIGDCERMRQEQAGDSFDLSELKEPFRLEGVKTMGYELLEQMGWEYPVAMFCPIGIGILAIWKAFEEMEQLGWVTGRRPRVYVVSGDTDSFEMNVVRESDGRVVDGGHAMATQLDWAKKEGFLLSPEGAAGVGAYRALLASGELWAGDKVVLINGSAGVKYVEATAKEPGLRPSLPSSLPVGGIITPQ